MHNIRQWAAVTLYIFFIIKYTALLGLDIIYIRINNANTQVLCVEKIHIGLLA